MLQYNSMPQVFLKAPMLIVAIITVALFGVAALRGLSVKQRVLLVQTETTPSPTPLLEPTQSPLPSSSTAPSPNASSPASTSVTSGCNNGSTDVTVNGKKIPADGNGNVSYNESNGGSNVNVKINNGCNQQSSSKSHTSINSSVRVNTNTGQ